MPGGLSHRGGAIEAPITLDWLKHYDYCSIPHEYQQSKSYE